MAIRSDVEQHRLFATRNNVALGTRCSVPEQDVACLFQRWQSCGTYEISSLWCNKPIKCQLYSDSEPWEWRTCRWKSTAMRSNAAIPSALVCIPSETIIYLSVTFNNSTTTERQCFTHLDDEGAHSENHRVPTEEVISAQISSSLCFKWIPAVPSQIVAS